MSWPTLPLRRVIECLDRRRVPLNREERSEMAGEVPYWGAGGVLDHVSKGIFDEPLVLLGEDGAPFFTPGKDVSYLIDGPAWINNHIHVLRPVAVNPSFLRHVLNCVDYSRYITGSTRDKLTQEDMLAIDIAYPPLEEQRRIADFLDAETARIDRLLADQFRMVSVIDERKGAMISHLVYGRNDGGGKRDSCIPTVGTIPSHWRVLRNKMFLREVVDLSVAGDEELLSVSHLTGVTPRSEKDVNMFMAESMVGYKLCRPGDLVINTLWAWMGALGVSSYSGMISPAYGVYRFTSSAVDGQYLDLLVRTPEYVTEMARFSKGVWTSRLRLYPESFLALSIPVPPRREQAQIVELVVEETTEQERLKSKLEAFAALLAERRQALITAAVTGQFDVTTARRNIGANA